MVFISMASCFDFRSRTTSLDLHSIENAQKRSLLAKLFRSRSDNSLRSGKRSPSNSPTESQKSSPKASPGAAPRRRFARVIRDGQQVGEEYVNPHVVRKYNKGYWEEQCIKKSYSLDEQEKPLPYVVSGQTILKKTHSVDSEHPSNTTAKNNSPANLKKCFMFNEKVEVIEYDIKSKCLFIMDNANISHEKLHDTTYDLCVDMDLLQTSHDTCPIRNNHKKIDESDPDNTDCYSDTTKAGADDEDSDSVRRMHTEFLDSNRDLPDSDSEQENRDSGSDVSSLSSEASSGISAPKKSRKEVSDSIQP